MTSTHGWSPQGKTIHELIAELRAFEDDTLEVRISTDDGATHRSISLVARMDGYAVLLNSEEPAARR